MLSNLDGCVDFTIDVRSAETLFDRCPNVPSLVYPIYPKQISAYHRPQ